MAKSTVDKSAERPTLPTHGAATLPSVEVDSYNLEIEDERRLRRRQGQQGGVPADAGGRAQDVSRRRRGRPPGRQAERRDQQEEARRAARQGRSGSRCRRAKRDREFRATVRVRDQAVPEDQDLARYRMHRGGRRLSRQPCGRAGHRSGRHHPEGGDRCRSATDPPPPRRGSPGRSGASPSGLDDRRLRRHPRCRRGGHEHPRGRRGSQSVQGQGPVEGPHRRDEAVAAPGGGG